MAKGVQISIGVLLSLALCKTVTCTGRFNIVPSEMDLARDEQNCPHFDFEPKDTWENNGLSGKYLIGDRDKAQQICLEHDSDIFNLLGFSRARLVFMRPDRSLQEHLMNTPPTQQWLKEVYLNQVDKFSKIKVPNIYQ